MSSPDPVPPGTTSAPSTVVAPPPASTETPPASTATPPAPAEPAAPPASTAPASTPPPQERAGEFARRFHLVLGGGISPFGTRTYMNSPVYERAAPSYGTPGGMFFAQPSASVFLSENFDFRIGAALQVHALSRSQTPGAPESSITALAISPLFLEGNWTPHPFFGIGTNVELGYMGLISSNADVGAPFDATLDFGDQGGIFFGLQAYVSTWHNAVRLGYSLSTLPGGYSLPTVPTDPRAASSLDPIHTFFIGVDPVRAIGNFAGARWF